MKKMTRREFTMWRCYLRETPEPEKTEAEKAIDMLSAFGELSPEEKDQILRCQ